MTDRQPFGCNKRVVILLQAFSRRVALMGQFHIVPVRSTLELHHDLELRARAAQGILGQSHDFSDERNHVILGRPTVEVGLSCE
jgi:hypothetical protein